MTAAVVGALPWIAALLFVRYVVRFPSALPDAVDERVDDLPFVSVIVPARNEEHNIGRCVRSLARSDYPAFEIVVVDDRSEDRTAKVAAAVDATRARRVHVVEGRPLPDGWLGKPWACRQGADAARGDLLLFTDADTVHGPRLLERAVRGLREERADLLTLVGRQLMETFWERLVQPQVFLMMLFRFPDFERVARNDRWRDAIANGQYILMPRGSYDRVGGHAAVRDEVVEDLALAQHVKRAGMRLRIRTAEDDLATRMYRSLAELVAGWSKNMALGGQQSLPGWMRPWVPPVALLAGIALWLVPPGALFAALGHLLLPPGGSPGSGSWVEALASPRLVWAGITVSASAAQFMYFTRRMGAPAWYGLLYPLGAAVVSFILLRSWAKGRNVRWKGRAYRVPAASARP